MNASGAHAQNKPRIVTSNSSQGGHVPALKLELNNAMIHQLDVQLA